MKSEATIKITTTDKEEMTYSMIGDMDLLSRMVLSAMENNPLVAKVIITAAKEYTKAETLIINPTDKRQN